MATTVVIFLLIAFVAFWALAMALGVIARYGSSAFRALLKLLWRPLWESFGVLARSRQKQVFGLLCLLVLLLVFVAAQAGAWGMLRPLARVSLPLATLLALTAWGLGVELVQRQRYKALWAQRVAPELVDTGGVGPPLEAVLAVRPRSSPWFFGLTYVSLAVVLLLLLPMGPLSVIEPWAGRLQEVLAKAAASPGRVLAWYRELDYLQQGCFWYLSLTGFWLCMGTVVSFLALFEFTRPLPQETAAAAKPVLDEMQGLFKGVLEALGPVAPLQGYSFLSALSQRTQLASAMCGPGVVPDGVLGGVPTIGLLERFDEGERLRAALAAASRDVREAISEKARALRDRFEHQIVDASITFRFGDQEVKLAGVALQAFIAVIVTYTPIAHSAAGLPRLDAYWVRH